MARPCCRTSASACSANTATTPPTPWATPRRCSRSSAAWSTTWCRRSCSTRGCRSPRAGHAGNRHRRALMPLAPAQWQKALAGDSLAPVYLLAGEELLVLEAADALRAQAKRLGYTEREVLEVEQRFDWDDL